MKLQIVKNGKIASWAWIALATSLFLIMMACPSPADAVDQFITS